MIALSVALVVLGGLTYDLARREQRVRQPLPPHEQLAQRVKELEAKVDAVMARAGFEVMK